MQARERWRTFHRLLVSSPWTPSSRGLCPRTAALRFSQLRAGFARLPQELGGLCPPAPPMHGDRRGGTPGHL